MTIVKYTSTNFLLLMPTIFVRILLLATCPPTSVQLYQA